jgi:DNA-binding GntR family transcriptional regulator
VAQQLEPNQTAQPRVYWIQFLDPRFLTSSPVTFFTVEPLPTKAGEIALVLENAILAGELPPGSLLRQEHLSREFGVSRTPIREALRQLSALGLVSFAGKRGVQVRPLARSELLETFMVRAALESFAAELARGLLTQADIRTLERAEKRFAELTRVLRAGGPENSESRAVAANWVRANEDFHDVYLEACGVRRLADAARSARRVFHGQAVWAPGAVLNELYSLNLKQHRQIREAFAARSAKVRRLVERHILDSGRLLERAMDEAGYGEAGRLGRRVSWLATSSRAQT